MESFAVNLLLDMYTQAGYDIVSFLRPKETTFDVVFLSQDDYLPPHRGVPRVNYDLGLTFKGTVPLTDDMRETAAMWASNVVDVTNEECNRRSVRNRRVSFTLHSPTRDDKTQSVLEVHVGGTSHFL
jgi:hypothetical protein